MSIPDEFEDENTVENSYIQLGFSHICWYLSRVLFAATFLLMALFFRFPLEDFFQLDRATDLQRAERGRAIKVAEETDLIIREAKASQRRFSDFLQYTRRNNSTIDQSVPTNWNKELRHVQASIEKLDTTYSNRTESLPLDMENAIEDLIYSMNRTVESISRSSDKKPSICSQTYEADEEYSELALRRLLASQRVLWANLRVGQD